MQINWKPLIEPLTAEEIEAIFKANQERSVNPKLMFNYGRYLGEWWSKLDYFELLIEADKKKKKEDYKRKILNQIKNNKEEYQESNSDTPQYYLFSIKHWENWRTMQIAIPWYWERPRLFSVLIEENKNPEFFEECLRNYKPF